MDRCFVNLSLGICVLSNLGLLTKVPYKMDWTSIALSYRSKDVQGILLVPSILYIYYCPLKLHSSMALFKEEQLAMLVW